MDCSNNQLTELDVSKNTALTELYCNKNQLTKLDVSNNTALTTLYCASNKLTELDVSNNTALTSLYCASNKLTELDVSNNTVLTRFDFGWNQLTELNVSNNTALEYLNCEFNKLTELDVSNNTALTMLPCGANKLTKLDVSKNTELKWLDCRANQLTSLDVTNTNIKVDVTGDDTGVGGTSYFDASSNSYYIEVDPENRFELKNLPGNFNVKNASNWIGGSVSVDGTTLTVDEGVDKVTYTYDCGTSKAGEQLSATFTLDLTGDNVNPDIPADGGHTGGGSGSMIGGIIIGGVLAWGAYEAGTGIYRVINMPGITMPSNRGELAMLLWEHAGKPELTSTALYSDIDESDTDAQKAARWAVEQGLMQDNSEKNTFNPRFPVSKLRTCLTWNAAKEKGLFDTDKTAE